MDEACRGRSDNGPHEYTEPVRIHGEEHDYIEVEMHACMHCGKSQVRVRGQLSKEDWGQWRDVR